MVGSSVNVYCNLYSCFNSNIGCTAWLQSPPLWDEKKKKSEWFQEDKAWKCATESTIGVKIVHGLQLAFNLHVGSEIPR